MSIVAITLGSLGDQIGRRLAEAFRYEFVDREIILGAAERFGTGAPGLYHVTEERPTLWESASPTRSGCTWRMSRPSSGR